MTGKRQKRPRRLTTGMIKVILLCWILPYIILSAVLIAVSARRSTLQAENTLRSSMEGAGQIVMDDVLSAIEDSRQASYDGVIKKAYETFLRDGDEGAMHAAVTAYLNKTYKFSRSISNTILLYGDEVKMEYYTYSNAAGATYASIEEFKRDTAEAVRLTAKDLDTKTRLICLGGHLYVVRNIVLSNYEPFATFVMELNMDRLFESMDSVIWMEKGIAVLEGETAYSWAAGTDEDEPGDAGQTGTGSGEDAETERKLLAVLAAAQEKGPVPKDRGMVFAFDAKESAACLEMKVNGQRYAFVISLDRRAMFGERAGYLSVYLVVFITLIPLIIATFWFFYANINQPISALMEGSDQIRAGRYGYEIPAFSRNEEMSRLTENFNHMSRSLEESFRRIYAEEVAGRDAALKALQSQINPHFLNNTLEIINWKARMNGSEDVSEMISALSVMMNAALNRNNEMFIRLEEELTYVDAYLYIIKERFGDRFQFEKEVDPALLGVSVPRLIIQPIVENAVEHGGDAAGMRTGKLSIYGNTDELHIVVENNGALSERDRERIAALLADAEEMPAGGEKTAPDSSSIGIRNVHRRLRLIYGKESGLTIRDSGDGRTVSELVICRGQGKADPEQ